MTIQFDYQCKLVSGGVT